MLKEAIGTGDNEVEALNDAKKQLGLSEDAEVEFEVIQRAEKKKFGLFGGSPAKVRAFIKSTPVDKAEVFLKDVLNAMKLSDITVETKKEDSSVEFDLEGENIGFVIGRRGETLDALQYLTSLVANHAEEDYCKVTVNTGNYREKREKTLEILGRKMAFKAVKSGKKVALEPMNPYERRIIHTAVQKVNGVISESEGENLNRHVVILPDPNARNFRRGAGTGGYNRNRGPRRPYQNTSRPQEQSQNSERKPINEGGSTGLYGRIDK